MNLVSRDGLAIGWVVGALRPPQLSAAFIVKGAFVLRPDAPAQALEEPPPLSGTVHYDENPERSVQYESDFAPFKPRTDLLVVGSCHVPGGKAVGVCPAGIGLGRFSKRLAVIGDRAWKGGMLGTAVSEPVPFKRMPLRYENAFGGAGFAQNPVGKGAADNLLPNVEYPGALIGAEGEVGPPAGFGPIAGAWPQRMAKAGSYGAKWLKERWPWWPEDFDWSYFNAAPRDQQLEGYLKGDEEILFENMHPQRAMYKCRLPGRRARCFVRQWDGGRRTFSEVPLSLDTAWVDMDRERLILLWRGAAKVRFLDLRDVTDVMAVAEPLDQAPRLASDYRRELMRRKAEELREQAPAPPRPPLPAITPPSPQLGEEMVQMEAEFESLPKQLAPPPPVPPPALAGRIPPVPPPAAPASLADVMASYAKDLERLRQSDPRLAALPPPPAFEDLPETEEPPPAKAPRRKEPWTRERCAGHAARKGAFVQEDLHGLDLSELDFSGCDLTGAVLAGCNLKKTRWIRSRLAGAVLSKADLTEAVLTGSVLTDADLAGSLLATANLDGADLSGADLSKAKLPKASLVEAKAARAVFVGADLTQAVLRGGSFRAADFSQARMKGADFSKSDLSEAGMLGTWAREARFEEANLTRLRSGEDADFGSANFARATAPGSVWELTVLDGANFVSANLQGANMFQARLRGTLLVAADLRHGRLQETLVEGASFVRANLFNASFEAARIQRADFTNACLFSAEFAGAFVKGSSFSNANVKRASLAQARIERS